MPEAAIQVLDVTKRYGSKTVLDAIRLDVFRGETLVILGGSGSGKSTLLRLMIGNVKYDGGDIVGLPMGSIQVVPGSASGLALNGTQRSAWPISVPVNPSGVTPTI